VRFPLAIAIVLLVASRAFSVGVRCYEGDVLPEDLGWTRAGSGSAERWLDGGWFTQHIEAWYDPPYAPSPLTVCSSIAIMATTQRHWTRRRAALIQSTLGRTMAGSAVAAVAR